MPSCATAAKESEFRAKISAAQAEIRSTIDAIHKKAKNAKIVLMGYPELFRPGVHAQDPVGGISWQINEAESSMISRLAYYTRDHLAASVQTLKTRTPDPITGLVLADPIKAFEGHRIGDGDEWINRPVLGPEGEGDFPALDLDNNNPNCLLFTICVSRTSFHPKAAGARGHASVLTATLIAINYRW